MNLWQSLRLECIQTEAAADSSKAVLEVIGKLASSSPILKNHSAESITKALTAREALSSTGLSDGVAIPHCSFNDIEEFVVGVVITRNPIDFSALDNKQTQIFIFLIGPADQRNKHIRLLSSIAKAIREVSVKRQLLHAANPAEVSQIFHDRIDYIEPIGKDKQLSKVEIFIQEEEYFDDILELLSSETEGSIAVYETENANRYLHHMPLFAAFWTDQVKNFSRVITAVIDKEAVNSTIRRIQTIIPDMQSNSGVMITVQDLSFAIGSIDF